MMRLALAGGGTGGHVYPILSVLATIQSKRPDLDIYSNVFYLGSSAGIESRLAGDTGIAFHHINGAPVRGRSPISIALNLLRNCAGAFQSAMILRRHRTQAVLATGGYSSVPVVIAAWLLGIPSLIYLPDAYPGWAVKFLSSFASKIAVTSPEAAAHLGNDKTVITGYPVRPEFFLLDKASARQNLSLEREGKVVLIMGGSQGAASINQAVEERLEDFVETAQIMHVCGPRDLERLQRKKEELSPSVSARYRLYGYLNEELPYAMVASDLVICRSGASVLGELPAAGVAAILVPYPHAGAHQMLNAKVLAEAGAAAIIEEQNIEQLMPLALELLKDDKTRLDMASKSKRIAAPNAAEKIFLLMQDLINLHSTRGTRPLDEALRPGIGEPHDGPRTSGR